ncbi:hypothetical protein CGX53_17765 [Salmonella enterica]|uniref:Uncharacterized protein n=2 Tax=Salmonella enterica TaxID=28901 RepID=A0A742SLA1_SALER|nr:hypothetical protein [Salmonella enterica subsp. enterica serovar Monschaui]EAB6354270.1 hypothetical protein [Salmonella enterica subsp. enterica]EAM3588873.1 hypothetical protein [Salmonella enterica]EBG2928087.1 hypothetical protein [Salmonella enterica subsp. enterica serovar Adelaide]EBV0854936.1 hypothetical protein [Salmonella enterica subsp. enterica serovar Anecho]EBY3006965.1 hypothetical protein [Salmonella enterica subsp. enterica serovar Ekpoui]EDU4072773.1 hypothetical protei
MLSKNSHLRHNHFYSLICINFIFLMDFVLLSLSLFFFGARRSTFIEEHFCRDNPEQAKHHFNSTAASRKNIHEYYYLC